MASESCSTLSVEIDYKGNKDCFFLAKGDERGTRCTAISEVLKLWEWDGLGRGDLDTQEVKLIPLSLLKFNNEGN